MIETDGELDRRIARLVGQRPADGIGMAEIAVRGFFGENHGVRGVEHRARIAAPELGFGHTAGPIVADGKVISGRKEFSAFVEGIIAQGIDDGSLPWTVDPKLSGIFVLSILNALAEIERECAAACEAGAERLPLRRRTTSKGSSSWTPRTSMVASGLTRTSARDQRLKRLAVQNTLCFG